MKEDPLPCVNYANCKLWMYYGFTCDLFDIIECYVMSLSTYGKSSVFGFPRVEITSSFCLSCKINVKFELIKRGNKLDRIGASCHTCQHGRHIESVAPLSYGDAPVAEHFPDEYGKHGSR